jgi:hypothetical protein
LFGGPRRRSEFFVLRSELRDILGAFSLLSFQPLLERLVFLPCLIDLLVGPFKAWPFSRCAKAPHHCSSNWPTRAGLPRPSSSRTRST